jgi:hypothetical protein
MSRSRKDLGAVPPAHPRMQGGLPLQCHTPSWPRNKVLHPPPPTPKRLPAPACCTADGTRSGKSTAHPTQGCFAGRCWLLAGSRKATACLRVARHAQQGPGGCTQHPAPSAQGQPRLHLARPLLRAAPQALQGVRKGHNKRHSEAHMATPSLGLTAEAMAALRERRRAPRGQGREGKQPRTGCANTGKECKRQARRPGVQSLGGKL